MKLRVLIADDHDIVRRGLRNLVESQAGWEVCAEAADGRQAVAKALASRPDVAILDISMPEMDGLTATRKIREALPQTEVLVLTQHKAEVVARQVLKAGARGYILKSDAGDELVAAINALQRHKPFFTKHISEALLTSYLAAEDSAAEEKVSTLTPREREIVQLLAEGKSNKEIATALDMSVKTVETHRANIMRKLELHSLSELVLYAVRNRIVQP
jgi:DNA-binding NarL/FixJ family response regulator